MVTSQSILSRKTSAKPNQLGQDEPHRSKSSPYLQASQATSVVSQPPILRHVSGNHDITPSNNLCLKVEAFLQRTFSSITRTGEFLETFQSLHESSSFFSHVTLLKHKAMHIISFIGHNPTT